MNRLDGKPSCAAVMIATIVPARDVRRSTAVYEQPGFEAELYDDRAEYAFLHRDEQQVHLRFAADLGDAASGSNPTGMYLYVDDVDAMYEEVLAEGVVCLGAPETKPLGMREFAASDPDGRCCDLASGRPGCSGVCLLSDAA